MSRSPHLDLVKNYWKELIHPGDVAIDATCGNGWDTLFLAKLPLSLLFAFDIQSAAIAKTRALLQKELTEEQYKRITLCCASHAQFPMHLKPRLIVYNLGYLPGGNKELTTCTETTLSSVTSALSILQKNGAISITCYPGHKEGAKEEEALCRFVSLLSPTQWDVHHHRLKKEPQSPSLLWIRNC
jgi:hypothetical protein